MTANYLLLVKDGKPIPVRDNVQRPANGSFDANVTGWTTDASNDLSSYTTGGPGSLAMSTVAPPSVYADSELFSVIPGADYVLSASLWAPQARRRSWLGVTWYNASGVVISGSSGVSFGGYAETSWGGQSYTVTVPASGVASARIRVEVEVQGSERAYVDDVAFTPVGVSWGPSPSGVGIGHTLVARDPDVTTDDSSKTVGTQVYDHGAPICQRLVSYLQGTQEAALAWPLPTSFQVRLIPGPAQAVAANGDFFDHGFHKITGAVPAAVGTGTVRQLISGDEGTNRKVAAILDLLRATTTAQRTTIQGTFTNQGTAFWTAYGNACNFTGTGHAYPYNAAQIRFHQRAFLNMWLAVHAVGSGFTSPTGNLQSAVAWGLWAVTALEHGFIASADYQVMTEPLDSVLAMPTGY